ncbi:RidA family protein [Sporobolomyces koalae]|uniref:RidA family protein n=1 Tax=Sporobolomyces koalae TaxID=500713 RepID=UPI00316CCD3C
MSRLLSRLPLTRVQFSFSSRIIATRPYSSTRNMSAPYTTVSTPNAPSAVGPYSQAIKTDSLIFCSGCVPLVPETMKVIEGGVEEQTEQAMKNLTAVVEAAGSDLSHVVKTTVFLKNMDDFAKVNAIYTKHFGQAKPARSCVEVARLPLGVLFEIEAIAVPKK